VYIICRLNQNGSSKIQCCLRCNEKKNSLAKNMKSPLKLGRRRKKLTLKTSDEKKTKEQ
jgi:hypothetical protein